jgi:protoporphyrinogen oxidase
VIVSLDSGERRTFDRAILTMPAPVAARLCPQLTEDEKQKLQQVEYQGIVCASLLLRKALAGYYVTNITDSVPFTAVVEMSALVDRKHFGGNSLIYLPKYLPSDDPWFNKTDQEIKQIFLPELMRMYPDLSPSDVLSFQVSRVKHVFAIPTLNYSSKLPPIFTSIAGVQIVNSAHIVNGTLNVNDTVKLAEGILPELLASANRTQTRVYADV